MNIRHSSSAPTDEPGSFRRDASASHFSPAHSGHAIPPHDADADPLYRELLECAADGIYGLDLDGYVTYVNPTARRLTGWTIDDLRGRTQHSMVHHSHPDGSAYPREDCPIYAALRDGRVHRRSDEVFWRKDGSSLPVSYSSSPIFRNGKPAGAVVVFRDLTPSTTTGSPS